MIDRLLFLVLALYALARGGGGSPQQYSPDSNADELTRRAQEAEARAAAARQAAQQAQRSRGMPVSWPQATPPLPPFPSGWEYADPVTAAVKARAWQLLNELWARGEGSTRVEQTGGTWITYRAEITRGAKRGVVAYRVKAGARRPAAPAGKASPRLVTSPGLPSSSTARAQKLSTPAAPAAPGLPVLHQGAGMGALAHLAPSVRRLQSRLLEIKVYSGKVDGAFGPKTAAAVLHVQHNHGLTQDGIVGPKTWAAIGITGGLTAMAS